MTVSTMRRSALVLLLLAVAAAGVWWMQPAFLARLGLPGGAAETARPARPTGQALPVEVARAARERVADQVDAIGTLAANEQINVAPEVAGRVVALHFREGQRVEAGAKLVELDATIANAELRQAQANLSLAQDVFDRSQTLVQRGAGTQVALEQATAQLAVARANVASAESKLQQLTLTAPFSGVVGLRSVSVGTIVPAGQAITTLTQLDPIKLDFSIPELFIGAATAGQTVDVRVDAFPDQRYRGEVYAIDPVIDASGRALRLRATIPNAGGALRPGLFARVSLTTAVRENAVVIPEAALVASASGRDLAVYVVREGRAAMTTVSAGRRFDGRVEIVSGLEAGATVVVAGQIRLRDGAPVNVIEPPRSPAREPESAGPTASIQPERRP
jgi:membrane fusion protein (multidrug efflux system)